MPLTPEQTAAQLRCPHGDTGKALGQAMNLRNLPMIINAYAALDLQPHARILEIGYGNGGLLGYILSLADNLHYSGVETSPLMHAEALAFNQPFIAAGLAAYHHYNGTQLPFAAQSFDNIISINTLYFWEHPAALLAETCRVLKSGGRLCLSFCDKNFMQTLPFAAHGFTLYDRDDLLALTQALPLHLAQHTTHRDTAIDKNGHLVARRYINMLFVKT